MSTLKVDAIRHNSATSDAITTAADGTCTAKLTSIGGGGLSNRNLVINGAMMVAQRATTSTDAGYNTVDRFKNQRTGNDEAPTYAQVAVASGTTPYSLGFRKAFKITNGNQTGGAGASDYSLLSYVFESQDMATSGWNYTSTSSFITLQFWVKSSVAQNFFFSVFTQDGTQHQYTMETGSLTADTWTKIIKTIPGNSNVQFDTDTQTNSIARAFDIQWMLFRGTDTTGTRPLNAWAAVDSTSRAPDMASTWYTTNDSTFELTGVQLEVGDTATTFEHRKYGDELRSCQRYYFRDGTDKYHYHTHSGSIEHYEFPVQMRDNPTVTLESVPSGGSVNRSRPNWVTITGMGSNSGNIKLSADAEI